MPIGGWRACRAYVCVSSSKKKNLIYFTKRRESSPGGPGFFPFLYKVSTVERKGGRTVRKYLQFQIVFLFKQYYDDKLALQCQCNAPVTTHCLIITTTVFLRIFFPQCGQPLGEKTKSDCLMQKLGNWTESGFNNYIYNKTYLRKAKTAAGEKPKAGLGIRSSDFRANRSFFAKK